MRATTLGRLLSAAVVLACATARADERTDKLDKGELVVDVESMPGTDVPRLTVTGVVEAPPARVWPLIEDCRGYKRFMPRTVESEELSRDGNVVRCRTVIDFPWPLDDMSSVTRAEHKVADGKWTRTWTLESGDYHRLDGQWVLTPFKGDPNRTLAVYRMHAVTKASLPAFIRDAAQKNSIPDVVRALRSEVKKRGGASAGK